ncbi:hypothetical protein H9P43_008514 [Blastocladiella emersonii ATCC 22665]|nr:hypothetical protein H9P43_008514 [Blastocladiella emersonii ATCC 22665]
MNPSSIPRAMGGGGTAADRSNSGGQRVNVKNALRVNALESSLFSVAYITTQDNNLSPLLEWAITILEDIQLLSFSWSKHLHHEIHWIVPAIVEPVRFLNTYANFSAANVVALVVIALFVSLLVGVSLLMSRRVKIPTSVLQSLRIISLLLMTVCSIPATSLLVGGLHCINGVVPEFGVSCTGPTHLPLLVLDILAFVVFSPLIIISSLVATMIRILFVFLEYFMADVGDWGPWVYMILVTAGLYRLAFQFARIQPYYNEHMTCMRSGFASAGATSTFVTFTIHLAGEPDGAWVAVFPAAAVGFIAGFVASRWYIAHYFSRTIQHWFRITKEQLGSAPPNQPPVMKRRSSVAGFFDDWYASHPRSKVAANDMLPAMSLSPPTLDHMPKANDSIDMNGGRVVKSALLDGTSMDVINLARQRQHKKRSHVFDSPLQASTYFASFYGVEGQLASQELMRQLQQSRRSVPLDVKFQLFSRERSARSRGEGILDQTAIEVLSHQARLYHLRAMYTVRDFFESIRVATSIKQLSRVTAQLAEYQYNASESYTRLLARNSRDKNILRSYAQFLTQVEADTARATQILEFAEEVEATEARHHSRLDNGGGGLAGMAGSPSSQLSPSPHGLSPMHALNLSAAQDDQSPMAPIKADPELHLANGRHMTVSETSLSANSPDSTRRERRVSSGPVSFDDALNAVGKAPLNRVPSEAPMMRDDSFPGGPPGAPRVVLGGGSQTSGTSASRAQRQRIQARRVLTERIAKPLGRAWEVVGSTAVFLGCLSAGFVICLNFLQQTGVVLDRYTTMRSARTAMLLIVEAMRSMIYASYTNSPVRYQAALKTLNVSGLQPAFQVLPSMAQWTAKWTVQPPVYRMMKSIVMGNTTDYVPLDMMPMDAFKAVIQAGNRAINFTAPLSLTYLEFNSNADTRFIAENIFNVFDAVRTLSQSMVEYRLLVANSFSVMMTCLGVTLVALVALAVVVYYFVFHQFFAREDRVLQLLRALPKRAASTIVTSLEEEIESFREVTDGGDDELSNLDVRAVSIDRETGAAQPHRSRYYLFMTAAGSLLVGLAVLFMFLVTLQSTSVQMDMDRLIKTSDRRLFVISVRIMGNEFLMPADQVLTADMGLQYCRSGLYDFKTLHTALINDPDGLSTTFPSMTVFPRDWSKPPAIVEQPDIGFTKATASVPLNQQMDQFLDVATRAVNGMALGLSNDPTQRRDWALATALSYDVQNRLIDLHTAIRDVMANTVATTVAQCITMFAVTLAVLAVWAAAAAWFGARRLRREARTLATLLYLIPPAMLKEVPEVAKLIDSAGITLEFSSGRVD